MHQIHWPLYVLSRSIHYKNLTGAAPQVGLSQPQLSRLISQLEEELGIELLDRKSKRNTHWTAEAHRLAEVYTKSMYNLEHAIEDLQEKSVPKRIRVGTLEGMASTACQYAHSLLSFESLKEVHVDVYDLNELESYFLMGELDLMFSSRIPGGKKYTYVKELGLQKIENIQGHEEFEVLSNYEFGRQLSGRRKSKQRTSKTNKQKIVSNSLMVRKMWIESYGGSGSLPGKIISSKAAQGEAKALMIAIDSFHKDLWRLVFDKPA